MMKTAKRCDESAQGCHGERRDDGIGTNSCLLP